MAERDAELARLSAELRARQAALADAERAHAEALASVFASTSWRMTAPVRFMARRLGFQRGGAAPVARGQATERPTPVEVPPSQPQADTDGVASRGEVSPGPVAATIDAPQNSVQAPPIGRPAFSAEDAARQRAALGLDLELPALSIAVGVVAFGGDSTLSRRCVASAELALSHIDGPGRILQLEETADAGFAATHNRLMRDAFAAGADIYVAATANGLFHPHCLQSVARVVAAHGGMALVEAIRFPAEHAKPYDPITLRTDWACDACLAIPRRVFELTGGFDDMFAAYCADVDLSWRVRALGIPVLIAPNAMFLHGATNLPDPAARRQKMLASAVILGRKWDAHVFVDTMERLLLEQGWDVPRRFPERVPDDWRGVANFSCGLDFAPLRWQ